MNELTPITQAEISKMGDISEVKHIKDMAEAAEAFYKAQDAMLEASKAQEIKLRAIRQAGIILLPTAQGGMTPREERKRTDLSGPTRLAQLLDEAGISDTTGGIWQKVARVPVDKFESYLAEADYYQDEITIAGLLRFAGTWYGRSDRGEWETPQWLFDILNAEFHFTVDVCALPDNTKCPVYFTPDDDGLEQEWNGTCWMNPPYGREIKVWMEKARQSAENGATVVCLVPARPDTEWWWENCIRHEIRFIRGRLQWPDSDTASPFPSAVVIMRPDEQEKSVWWDVQGKASVR